MENIPLFVALGGGLASFVSPCVLPMIPVYFASLVGPGVLEAGMPTSRRPIFLHSLSFVLGFATVFTTMGALAGLTGVFINPNSPLVQGIAGSLIILFGLFMLAALKIPRLNFESRLSPSLVMGSGYLRSFLTGGIFTLVWTPCISPILGGILTLAFSSETALNGAYLLLAYSLGLGLPFLAIGAAFSSISPLLRRIQRHSHLVYIISGIILVLVGILVISGNLNWLIL